MKEQRSMLGWLSRQEAWVVPLILGVVYALVHFSMMDQYGTTWDEPLHRNWGLLYDLFHKTGDRSVLYMMPGNGVYYSPLYFFLNYELSAFLVKDGWLMFEANHVLTIFTSSFIVAFSYVLGRQLGGWKTGALTVLFLLGFPQFIAHSQYNPKDIPLMLSVLLTANAFLFGIRRNSKKWLLVSAALFGCSLAAKVTAIMLGPVFLAAYLAWISSTPWPSVRRVMEEQLLLGLLAALIMILCLVLCWPSSWGDLHLIPSSILFFLGTGFWSGNVLFLGGHYPGAKLPWFYTPFEYVAAMPTLMILVLLIGTAVFVVRLKKADERAPALFLLLWAFFPLLLTLKPGLVRYDGMRQFFFILPAFAVIAAVGCRSFIEFLARALPHLPKLGAACTALLFISFAHEVAIVHPYEGVYRNEIVRMMYPTDMEKELQVEYWGSVYKQGVDWLNEHAERNAVVCVPTAGALLDWYVLRSDIALDCSQQTSYLMFFTRYNESETPKLATMSPTFTIQRMGATLLKIYRL